MGDVGTAMEAMLGAATGKVQTTRTKGSRRVAFRYGRGEGMGTPGAATRPHLGNTWGDVDRTHLGGREGGMEQLRGVWDRGHGDDIIPVSPWQVTLPAVILSSSCPCIWI